MIIVMKIEGGVLASFEKLAVQVWVSFTLYWIKLKVIDTLDRNSFGQLTKK